MRARRAILPAAALVPLLLLSGVLSVATAAPAQAASKYWHTVATYGPFASKQACESKREVTGIPDPRTYRGTGCYSQYDSVWYFSIERYY
jgi:hypothetical protein